MSKRYERYYGRKRSRAGVVFLWILLLVLLVLTVGVFIILRNYVEYDENSRPYINLPFLHATAPSAPPDNTISVEVTPEKTPLATPSSSPTPSPSPTVPVSLQAAFVPFERVKAGPELDALADAVQNGALSALVIEVKSESGQLLYPSVLPLAVKAGVAAQNGDAVAVIEALRGQNVPLIAYLSCFKDAAVPQKDAAVGVKHTSGVNWLDGGKSRWLNPYAPSARQYLLDIIAELAGLGFDGVVLEHVNFPYVGSIQSISYGEQVLSRAAQMAAFLTDVRAVTDAHDMTLSCLVAQDALTVAASGLEAQTLFAACDTVLVPMTLGAITDGWPVLHEGIASLLSDASLVDRLGLLLPVPDTLSREAVDVAVGQIKDNWLLTNDKLIYPIP